MVTTRTSPKRLVRKLLKDGWQPVRNQTPTFTTGWWHLERRLPLVTVTTPDEVKGARAMTTSGAAHMRDGSVVVACWADSTVTVQGKNSEAVTRSLVEEMWDEIDRIITANQQSEAVLSGGFEFIELGPSTEIVDPAQSPPLYRLQGLVEYSWWHAP